MTEHPVSDDAPTAPPSGPPTAQPATSYPITSQPAASEASTPPPATAQATTPPAKRGASFGMVAAVAVAALVGGAGGAGTYALLEGQNDTAVSDRGSVTSNVMVNDVENATVITGVAASVAPSVVTLTVNGGSASGSGSGVVLSEDGYILTNAHVATLSGEATDPKIKVQTFDGRLFDATLVGSDPTADLAVVKVDGDTRFQPADFADSDELNVGDTAIAIGAPLGLSNTVTSGVVSALNRSITVASSAAPESEAAPSPNDSGPGPFDFWEFDNGRGKRDTSNITTTISLPVIQTDAAINPGNSGGALLDEDGRVIGINVAIASTGSAATAGSIGVGFSIPANYAKRVAFDLIKNGTASHGLLGATVADVVDDPNLRDSTTMGAAIQNVTPGGAAAKGGLNAGDVVTKFDGRPIMGKTDLTAQVKVLPGGSTAELSYVRGGKKFTTTVTLDEF